MRKVTIGGQTTGQVLTKRAPADYVLVTEYDPTVAGATHHELDRDDGYSYVGSDVAGDVTAVATSVASKAATQPFQLPVK